MELFLVDFQHLVNGKMLSKQAVVNAYNLGEITKALTQLYSTTRWKYTVLE